MSGSQSQALALLMETPLRHALKSATLPGDAPQTARVIYPGSNRHPQHALAKRTVRRRRLVSASSKRFSPPQALLERLHSSPCREPRGVESLIEIPHHDPRLDPEDQRARQRGLVGFSMVRSQGAFEDAR